MTHHQPIFYIARLVLETCTPLSIATGRTDGIADNLIVRDANGLPAIPGSSLAGVLRHLYQHLNDEDQTNQLFGSGKQSLDDKEPSTEDQETGNPSFVHVSWGCLHDQNDKPVEGLLDPDDPRWQDDKIIKDALQTTPIRRDHVKLNHRGVTDAKKQGKFERSSLTTGHRFSVELSLWSDDENDSRWEKLLNLLQRPDFRLGGGTRRGLGKLKMVRCHTGKFNLVDKGEFNQFSELTQSLAETRHLNELKPSEPVSQISLNLTPLEGYRFGGGVEPLLKNSQANLLTVTEPCIEWENEQGALTQKRVVIPASGVKGALSHRVAYYYNALNEIFAEKYAEEIEKHVGENNEAVRALFGYIEESKDKTKPDIAQIGCLIFDDVYQQRSLQIVEYMHNGVDRFTGGVREGVLFSEEVITDTQSFPLNITIANEEGIKPDIWKALRLALNDIAEGRLALGAGGGRGHGYFSAEWKNGEQWLKSKGMPLV
jgi:CRISPR/Cas system CSM-associated protein Csm3 (group 7 of RAMP superfamily)